MRKKKKVLVIAHDAGGAEVIAAYVNRFKSAYHFRIYVAGPARGIFRRLKLSTKTIPHSRRGIRSVVLKNKDAHFALLPLPGWMTKIEIYALHEAKRAGLQTVVYLDSWSGYKTRYGYPKRDWKEHLPDEFWAGDRFALLRAKKAYPRPVRYVRNEYFEAIRVHSKSHISKKSDTVLFLSNARPRVEQDLKVVLNRLSAMSHPPDLVIRFHPADVRTRFDSLLKKYPHLTVRTSKEKNLSVDLVRARTVIGTETVALAVASMVGKRAINLLPKNMTSNLPHPRIVRSVRLAHVTL